MQVLNRDQMAQYWTRVRTSGRRRSYPFAGGFQSSGAGYSMNDPHTFPQEQRYDEKLIFGSPASMALSNLPNSGALIQLNSTLNQVDQAVAAANGTTAAPGAAATPPAFVNRDRFTVTPFVTSVSVQVLAQNERRSGLLIQNQSATLTMFFNLGSSAGPNIGIQLAAGQGILFDLVVPNNYVTVAFVGGTGFGVCAEGSRG
jgi:hypothetical protein